MILPQSFDPQSIQVPHLVTIPYSHYCELARWALEHSNTEFKEIKYAPGYHTKRVGHLRKNRANRSGTSFVGQESGVHSGRRKYAVPLVCMPDGEILRDSWEILDHAWAPAEPQWRNRFDQELGICVRQIIYHSILTPKGNHLLEQMLQDASLVERGLWMLLKRKIRVNMRQLMAITPENVAEAQKRVVKLFEDVSQTLEERGGTIASDQGFGPTELAFSALSAACLLPTNYSNGAATLPPLEQFPQSFIDFATQCRETPAGQFAMECYKNQRDT